LRFAQKRQRNHLRNHLRRESDWISNADATDDKEVESELGDKEDEIVTDNGFGLSGGNWRNNAHKANQYNDGLRFV